MFYKEGLVWSVATTIEIQPLIIISIAVGDVFHYKNRFAITIEIRSL